MMSTVLPEGLGENVFVEILNFLKTYEGYSPDDFAKVSVKGQEINFPVWALFNFSRYIKELENLKLQDNQKWAPHDYGAKGTFQSLLSKCLVDTLKELNILQSKVTIGTYQTRNILVIKTVERIIDLLNDDKVFRDNNNVHAIGFQEVSREFVNSLPTDTKIYVRKCK